MCIFLKGTAYYMYHIHVMTAFPLMCITKNIFWSSSENFQNILFRYTYEFVNIIQDFFLKHMCLSGLKIFIKNLSNFSLFITFFFMKIFCRYKKIYLNIIKAVTSVQIQLHIHIYFLLKFCFNICWFINKQQWLTDVRLV